jgi:hypothetical protein
MLALEPWRLLSNIIANSENCSGYELYCDRGKIVNDSVQYLYDRAHVAPRRRKSRLTSNNVSRVQRLLLATDQPREINES